MNLKRFQLLESKCVKFYPDIGKLKKWLSRADDRALIKFGCHGSCKTEQIAWKTSKTSSFLGGVRMFCLKKKMKRH